MDIEAAHPAGTGEGFEARTLTTSLPAAPSDRGQRGGRTRVIVAIALALCGLAVMCAIGVVAVWGVDGWGRFATRAWGTSQQTSLEWSGEGRFLVAQLRERQGRPLASVWDRRTGATRTLEGYRVLAVEKQGAFAWVVTDPGHPPADYSAANFSPGRNPPSVSPS